MFPISVLKITQTGIEMSDYHYWLQCRLIAFVIVCCRMLPSCTLVLAKIRVRLLWMRTLIFGIWFSPHHLSYANHWFVLCTFSIENQTLKEVCSLYRHSAQQLNHFILLCYTKCRYSYYRQSHLCVIWVIRLWAPTYRISLNLRLLIMNLIKIEVVWLWN